MIKTAAVGVILNAGRKILLASNRRYGGWSLPGGMCEGTESFREGLRRELGEEAGIVPVDVKILGVWPGTADPEVTVAVYHVRTICRIEPWSPEDGTVTTWEAFETLAAQPRFGSFYVRHFPRGFDDLEPIAEI